MSFTFNKPFKPLDGPDGLIQLLKNRNLKINNDQYAKKVLSNTSYYTLHNGYKKHLTDSSECYFENITIEMLQSIYMIDIDINSIILKYILFIEKILKTQLSALIAEKYGVWTNYLSEDVTILDDYLNENNYSNSNGKRLNTLVKIKEDLMKCKEGTVTRYYINNKNHVPPWILVNDISFGNAILWFRTLKTEDKSIIVNSLISDKFNIKQSIKNLMFVNSLILLQDYRNKIAHGNRIFSNQINSSLKFSLISPMFDNSILNPIEYTNGKGKNDFFAVIIAFCILINDEFMFNSLGNDVVNILSKYSKIEFGGKTFFEVFNIPTDIILKMQLMINSRYR